MLLQPAECGVQKIAKAHDKIANIRKDFCHKASREIVGLR